MIVSLIAAVARNGVIGSGNGLPWRIRSDFQYFKDMTVGKPVIMGRKTFEGLPGGPLKDRPNIVITRSASYTHPSATIVHSIEEALTVARAIGAREAMVAGGAEIYAVALPLADKLYINEIDLSPQGDAHFPAFDRAAWRETFRERRKAQQGEDAGYTVTILERQSGNN